VERIRDYLRRGGAGHKLLGIQTSETNRCYSRLSSAKTGKVGKSAGEGARLRARGSVGGEGDAELRFFRGGKSEKRPALTGRGESCAEAPVNSPWESQLSWVGPRKSEKKEEGGSFLLSVPNPKSTPSNWEE